MSEETVSEGSLTTHSDHNKIAGNSRVQEPLSQLVVASLEPDLRYVIKLHYATVVQKSYGNEKRFVCPPPRIQFFGPRFGELLNQNDFRCSNTGGLTLHARLKDELAVSIPIRNRTGTLISGLYTTDRFKSRETQLEVEIHGRDRSLIGKLETERISVVSKPTIRKTHRRGQRSIDPPTNLPSVVLNQLNGLVVMSGMQICLYCRTRFQSLNTVFLHTNKTSWTDHRSSHNTFEHSQPAAFTTSIEQWTPVRIYLKHSGFPESRVQNLGDNRVMCEDIAVPGTIKIGSTIIFRSDELKLTSPPLIVEKVTPAGFQTNPADPNKESTLLGQLQKYAFRLCSNDSEHLYLTGVIDGSLGFEKQIVVDNHPAPNTIRAFQQWSMVVVDELNACWTLTPHFQGLNIYPIPYLASVSLLSAANNEFCVEIRGKHFLPVHIVYFGAIPALTSYRTSEMLLAIAPPKQSHLSQNNYVPQTGEYVTVHRFENGNLAVPVSLARPEGVVYSSNLDFIYDI